MATPNFERVSAWEWRIGPRDGMRVPAIVFADEALFAEIGEKVIEQLVNVAKLPGIVEAAYAMPDAHWGYGFPIGGVAAFDAAAGGVISGGGVGFDISCGVRVLTTGLTKADVLPVQTALADSLFHNIPSGLGSRGTIALDERQMDAMLSGGARWALAEGYGVATDLERIEEGGCTAGADPAAVSAAARARQRNEMGTLGSGNHYLEVQEVTAVHDPDAAATFGIRLGSLVVSIHCGSRGLGHQIGTEFLREMAIAAPSFGIELPDLELACAPILSPLGQRYLGAMRGGINCALANRQIIAHLVRRVFRHFFADADLPTLFDVSHNTCKEEEHRIGGRTSRLFVHRKGATRAFGPGHPGLPAALRQVGQPVFIGGSMGTASAIMVGSKAGTSRAFASACHGAGRCLSRHQALKRWHGRQIIDELAARGIVVRSISMRGVAEEAPGAYKEIHAVVEAAHAAGLARKVATLSPLVCIKG
jgi:tRNA-splicing ligase RtcB